ncbi:MAG TPA: amino acid adenylation domain-containing protein [Chthonomonadaceae bacterium]|nr:amino acid adenylation domain-containing protein [Chthonomonadaceae bacterium]
MIENETRASQKTLLEKRQALARAVLGSRVPSGQFTPIAPRARNEEAPLSFAQERLWLLDRWNPGSTAYNVPILARLKGELDLPALQNGLEAIVQRHEVLRSCYPVVEGRPVQRVCATDVTFPIVNLADLPEAERESAVQQEIARQTGQPFDLETGPLVRGALLSLSAQEHILILILHHSVTDAWSRGVFAQELAALYEAFRQQQPDPLPPLSLQYADFAAWQRSALDEQALERLFAYWRPQLAGAPALLELPSDRPRPAVQSYRGARLPGLLSPELSRSLAALAQQHNVTLFMILLAAFQVLLYRYSGQQDLVVGTPIANRTRPELEGLIGFFTNTLALRGDLSGDPSFMELLGRVRETCLGAYSHQDIPFEKLVETLQPERQLSYSPLFQVMFMFQTQPEASRNLPGLQIETLEEEHTSAKFDLILSLVQTPQGMETNLEYNTDLFDRERMERLHGHYQTLLEGIVAAPEQRISRLPLLPETERHRLVVEYNASAGECPRDICLHHLVEEQVTRTPDAVAVEYRGRQLTYAELNAEANRVAHHLRALGVGTEARVGICAERSLEMMIGLLGILKAGAAYLPIDATYPSQRVGLMCRDAEVAVVLTYGAVQDALAEVEAPRLRLEEARDHLPTENPGVGDPLSPLYVIYTSGSTGVPKGAVMPNDAMVNLMYWHRLALPGVTRTLQFTSLGFDVHAQEIFVTWCSGGTVVLVSEDDRRDVSALLRVMDEERVERLFVPFAMLQHLGLALAGGAVTPRYLREVITAGEQLQMTSEVLTLMSHLPGAPLHNHYGPSETFAVAYYTLRGDPASWPFWPPIGRQALNVQIYLLDQNQQLVPFGVPGEIYVGGSGLARGYLNRPELTAERFVPDPFSGRPGARLYRTGDLARYLPDGNIEFLGRVDHQVKIRGFRVELGEIESVLRQNPRVREAAVIAREDSPGDRRLVAYVVGTDPEVRAEELRERLREQLPGYMVPSAFVMMEALPLNANRKIDRKALPKPEVLESEQDASYAPPRNEVEEILAEIWGQALRLPQVGIHDSFFELGGHSLLATQVIARVREVFHVEIPLRDLFEFPTVALLSRKLAQGVPGDKSPEDATIRRVERDQPLPLSFAQERLWFMDQLHSGSSLFNLPMALRLHGKLDVEALRRALVTLQQRHEALRTVFAVHQGQPVQVIQEGEVAPLTIEEIEPLSEERKEEVIAQRVLAEAQHPFDLVKGPVYRCYLLRLGAKEHVMVLTLHHIAADDTTTAVFMRELSALYRAEITGQPVTLPQLPVQYADYAVWQRERFQQGSFQSQVDYWQHQLRNAPPILGIPTDYPRPAPSKFSRQSQRFYLSQEVHQQIVQRCREETTTPFMFFLATFSLLLSRHTGRKDILVGTDALNRDLPETQNLIGFFINQLVLRTDLSDCANFRQLLKRVRSVALEGYANQELPFNKLVEILRPTRDLERPPLYQVKLAYTKGEAASMELEGLTAEWIQADKGTAQLDLTLFLKERPDGVYGRLEYRDELYAPATITRVLKDYVQIVQTYAADPELALDAPEAVASTSKTDARERMLANRAKLLGRTNPKGAE